MPCLSSDRAAGDIPACRAVLVAGGSGSRMGSLQPKQFLPIGGIPVLVRTLGRFIDTGCFEKIVVVLPSSQFAQWEEISEIHRIPKKTILTVCGGSTRTESVYNGLKALFPYEDPDTLVAVHDGVRPFVSASFLHDCLSHAARFGNAIPAVTPPESFRYMNSGKPEEEGSRSIDRNRIRSIQTPQCFRLADLLPVIGRAIESGRTDFTDEASLMEEAGYAIHLCPGSVRNIKLTRPSDLELAEFFLQKNY